MPRSPYAAEPAAPPAEVAAPTRTPQGKVREKLDQSKPKSFKTYSRFGRDPEVYFWTIDHVLYGLARRAAATANVIRVWSAGCAGGEEPYSLAIAWRAVLSGKIDSASIARWAKCRARSLVSSTAPWRSISAIACSRSSSLVRKPPIAAFQKARSSSLPRA